MSATLERVTATSATGPGAMPWALGAVLVLQATLVLILTCSTGLAHNGLWLYCLTVPLFLIAVRLFALLHMPRRSLILAAILAFVIRPILVGSA